MWKKSWLSLKMHAANGGQKEIVLIKYLEKKESIFENKIEVLQTKKFGK